MRSERLRPGQQQALDIILGRVANRDGRTAIVLPTRYGKSDVIRLSSLAIKSEYGGVSIALSPSEFLRDQLVRPDKLNGMIFRYELEVSARCARTFTSAFEYRPFSNGEYLLSATVQLATRNIDLLATLVKYHVQNSHPFAVHVDECHETSEDKRRGELVQALEDAGASVVLYTATAIRADGEMIPGFSVEELSREDVRRYVTRDAGDGINNLIDVYRGVNKVVRLRADHETTFQQAWNEDPSPLCRLSRETIDVHINEIESGESSLLLSEASPDKARSLLFKAVRHPIVIEKGVELFLNALKQRQRVNPAAAGIIFTCSDVDANRGSTSTPNAHAKQIREEIERQSAANGYAVECCIVTMKSDYGDDRSSRQIEKFVGINGQRGQGDVLLVKQMGGAGLDSERIKVMLDLSNVRSVASVIQRLMRVATPWGPIKTATVITLGDPLMDAIWSRYIVEQGGEAPTSNLSELELERTYEKPKSDDPGSPLMEIIGASVLSIDDNDGTVGSPEFYERANRMFAWLPELANATTKAALCEALRRSERPEETSETDCTVLSSLADQIRIRKEQINERVGQLAQRDEPYNHTSRERNVERRKHYMSAAKRAAGVPTHIELRDINSLRDLDVMLNFLTRDE